MNATEYKLQGRTQKYRNFGTVAEAVAAGFDRVQPKWDGHFAEVVIENHEARVYSRTGNLRIKFSCPDFHGSAVLLGEFLIGTQRATTGSSAGRLVVFDCLYHSEDEALFGTPLVTAGYDRRYDVAAQTVDLIPNAEMVNHIEAHHAEHLWQGFVVEEGGEGLVFRRSDDSYAGAVLGRVKAQPTMDYVVMRAVEGRGKFEGRLGALVCGLYENGELVEKVSVGGGFTTAVREVLWAARARLAGRVVEVRGYEVFVSGSLRHPQFSVWRDDKRAEDCVWGA